MAYFFAATVASRPALVHIVSGSEERTISHVQDTHKESNISVYLPASLHRIHVHPSEDGIALRTPHKAVNTLRIFGKRLPVVYSRLDKAVLGSLCLAAFVVRRRVREPVRVH
jgi:hypothetical protein